ncbi:MAG: two-component sensor histidine kinase, partial [Desulfatiglandales bacterium]
MEGNLENIRPDTKRFRLVKFFAYTSLGILIISSFVLSMVISERATTVLMNNHENDAVLIAENLNHQVFHYFVLPVLRKYGAIRLREKEQSDLMDKIVRNTIHSFNIEKVNIYDIHKGQIAYSTDRDLIG